MLWHHSNVAVVLTYEILISDIKKSNVRGKFQIPLHKIQGVHNDCNTWRIIYHCNPMPFFLFQWSQIKIMAFTIERYIRDTRYEATTEEFQQKCILQCDAFFFEHTVWQMYDSKWRRYSLVTSRKPLCLQALLERKRAVLHCHVREFLILLFLLQ